MKEAVKLLNEYLKLFMADADAWMELADLHIELNAYCSSIDVQCNSMIVALVTRVLPFVMKK